MLSDTRICNEDEELTVITNGGSQGFMLIGNFIHLPIEVHYNADSLANVLSFKHVSEIPVVTITIDTSKDSGILVHMRDGTAYRFALCASGLYYHNAVGGTMHPEDTVTKPLEERTTNFSNNMTDTVYPTVLLNTEAENSKFYSCREIEGAKNARKLQQLLGWPGTSSFKPYINKNLINNCEVTVDDVSQVQFHCYEER